MNAIERILDALASTTGHQPRQSAGQWQARCPAHEDRNPSLSVRPIDGAVLVHCHAGCDVDDVLAALNLSRADLFDERKATYRYDDGRAVHRTYSGNSKQFRQSGNTKTTPTLYHLQRLLAATEGSVFLVEGEKDVHAIEALDGIATTAPMGAANFGKVDVSPLKGRYVTAVVDRDEKGQQWAEQVARALTGSVAGLRFMEAKAGKDAADHIAAGHGLEDFVPAPVPTAAPVEPTPATSLARVIRVSDVEPERVSWLWDGHVPRGKLTLIDGDPGEAKSTLSLDIAARVTTGSPMPDDSPGVKGTVLVLSAEDGIGDTIRPRLDAAGADTKRVIVLHEIIEDGQIRPPELPADIGHLTRTIREHDVVLVIIDPLMAFLAGVDSHNDQSVRRALHPLAKLADDTGAAILVIRHLNKGGGKALYRGGGSIGISGAARAVFLVAPDPEDETRRLLASVKVNIAVKPPTIAYRIVGDELHGCSRIQWEGIVSATADELVSVEAAEDRGEAARWLTGYLADNGGEAEAPDVYKAGAKNGFSQDQLKRAKKKAGVISEKQSFDSGWMWRLVPPREHGDPQGSEGGNTQGAAPFAPLGTSAAPLGDSGTQTGHDRWTITPPSSRPREAPNPDPRHPRDPQNGDHGGSASHASHASQESGPSQDDRPAGVACRVCGTPLDGFYAAQGADCHVGCEEPEPATHDWNTDPLWNDTSLWER